MPNSAPGRPCARRGFTLIELLVVIGIVGIAAAAIVGCFAAGIRLWDAARVFGDDEGHATLAMLEAERDLRNAAPLAALPFVGEAHAVTMAGLVQDQRHGDPSRRVIGSIRYRFEPDGGVLLKQTWPYPAETPGDGDGVALVEELEAFTCRYYEPREAQWLDAWADPSNLPARVAIELSCTSGAARIVLRQEVVLPLGGVAADEDEDAEKR